MLMADGEGSGGLRLPSGREPDQLSFYRDGSHRANGKTPIPVPRPPTSPVFMAAQLMRHRFE
jgi:hypothetical protein